MEDYVRPVVDAKRLDEIKRPLCIGRAALTNEMVDKKLIALGSGESETISINELKSGLNATTVTDGIHGLMSSLKGWMPTLF